MARGPFRGFDQCPNKEAGVWSPPAWGRGSSRDLNLVGVIWLEARHGRAREIT